VFLDELAPFWKELTQQPVSFLGGFMSGMLRLSLQDDPIKSWLDQQAGVVTPTPAPGTHNGNGNGPQSISID
jgi:hypothetical protein